METPGCPLFIASGLRVATERERRNAKQTHEPTNILTKKRARRTPDFASTLTLPLPSSPRVKLYDNVNNQDQLTNLA